MFSYILLVSILQMDSVNGIEIEKKKRRKEKKVMVRESTGTHCPR